MARILCRAVTVVVLACGWLANANAALACSCIQSDASLTCRAMTADAAIFTGTAVSSAPGKSASGAAVRRYTFQVDEAFHGLDGSPATVSVTVDAETTCAMAFEIGGRYLVFATHQAGGLETGLCTRTQRLSDARADLEVLRDVIFGAAEGRLSGRVYDYRVPVLGSDEPISLSGGSGVAGVDVVVTGPAGELHVSSDTEGWFTLSGLPFGRYRVQARPPANRVVKRPADDIVVGRCSSDVMIVTEVRSFEGVVLDADDRPVGAGLQVSLVADQAPGAATGSAPHVQGSTDNRGRVVVSGLPPGRYRFGVSVVEPPTAETPYAPTWSGATSVGTVLDISDRQTTRAVLRLPRRMSPRTIHGIVTDAAGGTPKGEVLVWLTDRDIPNSRVGSVKATAGRFRFEGLAGRRYTVYGYTLGGRPSALVDVADDPAQTVTIILPN